ncbi:type IX secretion system sortase PorU [Pontibacter cellulosilyticus]|uniref:Type IX secretion system sortase PorU n=1 Tax=Pontibacter cellulosilyticus TaxID=1720253 RepID=A0A923N9G9_9BACT|nr:type IX secretion system sortase PorU [Pontibacter cellulosilyticus]MBC5993826.1 type IX secretion system sortase PorU [Pontibacter cellulosilyticus]
MRQFRLVFISTFFLLSSFFTHRINAQQSIRINWQGYETVLPVDNLSDKVPTFDGATLDPAERLPYYRFRLQQHIENFSLTDAVYQPFTAAEQKLFGKYKFAASPEVHVVNSTENKTPVAVVTVLPIRRNPQTNQLEKLTSFSYKYTSASIKAANARAGATSYTSNSVLSSGNWYKLAVTSSGVYKIDKGLLQTLGINTQGLDPKTIQLYGNGGGMLPQPNNITRPDDLVENPVMVIGEADGRFDDNDYVLFYGQGPHTWEYDATQKQFKHNFNVYSDTAFYFLRVGSAQGKRISSRAQATGATQTITSYNERHFHERDLKNMVFSGREWYGEEFSSFVTSHNISLPISDIVGGSDVKLTAFLMANSPVESAFTIKVNNQTIGTQPIASRGTYSYHPQGTNSIKTYTISQQALGSPTALETNLAFGTGGSSTSLGYLNYLLLNYERQLRLKGDQTSFRSVASMAAPVSTFRITGAPAGAMVWDVTNPLAPVLQQTDAGTDISFSTATATLREFVVLQSNISNKPIAAGKVNNQNLHAQNLDGNLDFVIISNPRFLQEANRLAEHRRKHSGMQVLVTTTTQVFNEFSSGAQDVTAIRDFMRMLYKRSNKSGHDHMYLLLLGDASYDYKNRLSNNTNFVPIYESRQSLHPITSYSSEDYYGFLDDEEGEWIESTIGDHLLDVGIGRLPAKSVAEASTMVSKVINYDSPSHFGKWKSRVTLLADDGDYNEHQNDAEFLADFLKSNAINYNPNKVYIDLYRQVYEANGQSAPDAVAALNKAIEQGSLITNYTGHGNEVSLASEQLITIPRINSWTNKDRLTFLLTATCEFGRYDDPTVVSGAETALLHPNGGAVGLITTTRPVYSNGNRVLNRNFFKSFFTPATGAKTRLGDLVLNTKNNSITDNISGSKGVNNRNFSLLADPSQQLASTALNTEITHINNKAVASDTLSALGKINLKGQVRTGAGSVASNFNGEVQVTVYEKPVTLKTFGDDGSPSVPVSVRENVIYDGKATIKNGLFDLSFVVPKDIAYNYGQGKISLYASNQLQDALGANQSVVVGGTAKNVQADNTAPTLQLFMNDESFVFGGTTNKDAVLLAKLFDENGINTAGLGIGHEITAILDEQRDNLLVLNDYYTSEPDSYQAGRVKYTFKDLEPGPHSLRIKAWDTHNNAAEEYIEFIVSNDSKIALEHVLNHPNPFSTKTTFHFDHNRAGDNLEIQIQIYTISGKLVKTLETTSYASKAHLAELTWDGKDEYNDVLAKGVYIYKVNVRSQQDGSKTSKFEKLVILN